MSWELSYIPFDYLVIWEAYFSMRIPSFRTHVLWFAEMQVSFDCVSIYGHCYWQIDHNIFKMIYDVDVWSPIFTVFKFICDGDSITLYFWSRHWVTYCVTTGITITLCITAQSNPYTPDAGTDQPKVRLLCKSKDVKLKRDLNDAVTHESSSLDRYVKHWNHHTLYLPNVM